MYARLTTTLLASGEEDATGRVFEQLLPTMKELPGFRGMVVLSELDGRRIVALSLWESPEALEAAEPVLEKLKRAETVFREVVFQETGRFYVAGSLLPAA
jgi:hypothetical protein